MRLISKPPPSAGRQVDAGASVSIDSGSWPASPSMSANAIEKQPACAAAISSSGIRPVAPPRTATPAEYAALEGAASERHRPAAVLEAAVPPRRSPFSPPSRSSFVSSSVSCAAYWPAHSTGPGLEHVRAERPPEDLLRRRRGGDQSAGGRSRSRSPSRRASRRGPRSRCSRSRREAPGSRRARRTRTRTSRSPARARRARWRAPGRACCGSARSARRRRAARARAAKNSPTWRGFAIPVVSPNAISAQPAAASRSAIAKTRSGGTSPS